MRDQTKPNRYCTRNDPRRVVTAYRTTQPISLEGHRADPGDWIIAASDGESACKDEEFQSTYTPLEDEADK